MNSGSPKRSQAFVSALRALSMRKTSLIGLKLSMFGLRARIRFGPHPHQQRTQLRIKRDCEILTGLYSFDLHFAGIEVSSDASAFR